jgi:hypothetical protein
LEEALDLSQDRLLNKYIYIRILNLITNAPTCSDASAPSSGSFDIAFAYISEILKLLKLHKTADRSMIKSVLVMKCDSGCICNSIACNELI